jgi:pimeloyl-ACP methyl ester carboxylesterase
VRTVRPALTVTILAVPLAVADPATATATVATAGGRPPAIEWTACPEDATAQCGTVRVPVDWARPDGQKFDLALARRPATEPGARIGSLQINPGGPGGSGREFAIFGAGYFSEEIRSRFDIVGVDPRGVGQSHPVLCSTDLVEQEPSFLLASQADFDARLAYNARLRADCRARTGPLFDHLDMVSVARDMDHVRAALGDAKLTYYGVSYGSMNAQQYAELFPGRIRAIVSDSNLDHSLGTGDWLDTEAASAQDSFDEFVAWSDRTATSALHGRDVRALWHSLLDRAARGEIPHPDDPARPLRPEELIGALFGALYGPDWAFLAEALSMLDDGTFPNEPPPDGEPPEVIPFPSLAIFCSDWSLPVRDFAEFSGHLRRLSRIAPDMRFGPPATALTVACLGTPRPIANPQHRLRVRGAATPVLVTNALHDPATGYNRALGVARQLGREGVLLTYDGWGHGVYGRSDCVNGTMDRYLIDRATPSRGTHCPGVEPPVDPPSVASGRAIDWPATDARYRGLTAGNLTDDQSDR